MGLFLSTFINKIDKKCRVSVPASFRAVLAGGDYPGIVVYDSFINESIEASGFDRIEKIHALIDKLEPFSEERDALATAVLGSAIQLAFDPEGRIILPPDLMEKSGLTDTACFVGKGATFEIWQPEKFAIYKTTA
jgi:MraZ protein